MLRLRHPIACFGPADADIRAYIVPEAMNDLPYRDPKEIRDEFLRRADEGYKKFSDTVTVPGDHAVIGIRMPLIKRFAKDICAGDWRTYLDTVGDEYHEDLLLRGLIISYAKTDIDEKFRLIRDFVPEMDNWAVCDSFAMSFRIPKKDTDAYWELAIPYLDTNREFQIRFAIVMMLAHFVDKEHIDRIIGYMDSIKHPGYYVKMAAAWCICECFLKFPDKTMGFLKNNTLDNFTFGKALSKITDSFRVDDGTKGIIRAMRRK